MSHFQAAETEERLHYQLPQRTRRDTDKGGEAQSGTQSRKLGPEIPVTRGHFPPPLDPEPGLASSKAAADAGCCS